MPYPRQPLWPRLLRRRRIDGACWIYTGKVTAEGYGSICFEGRAQGVHRLAYESKIGPIAEGLVIDHLCRTRACFNPAHLEPVTCRVNVLRGIGPAPQLAARTHCANGHPFDEINTYVRSDGARRCRTCARDSDRRRRSSTQPTFDQENPS